MRAGALRHQIVIQVKTLTGQNSIGEANYTWSTLATVWAAVKSPRGNEAVNTAANESHATREVIFEIRYLSSVTVENRVLFDSRYFDVNYIDDFDERHIQMFLHCSEVV